MEKQINEKWSEMMMESLTTLITSSGVLILATVLVIFLIRLFTNSGIILSITLLTGVLTIMLCTLLWGAGILSPMKELKIEREAYDKEVVLPYLEKTYKKTVKVESYKVTGEEVISYGELMYQVEAVYKNEKGILIEERRNMTIKQNGTLEHPAMTYIELENKIGPYYEGKEMYGIEYPENEGEGNK